MIIRHPLTVLTLAALLMAGGAALAGGMPSDEGPEVVPEELSFNTGGSLDEDSLTAIIKSQLSDYVLPAAFAVAVSEDETAAPHPRDTPEIKPVLTCPECVWQNVDH